jgi:hypothetical protein
LPTPSICDFDTVCFVWHFSVREENINARLPV